MSPLGPWRGLKGYRRVAGRWVPVTRAAHGRRRLEGPASYPFWLEVMLGLVTVRWVMP